VSPLPFALALLLLASLRAHGSWGVAYAPVDTAAPRPAIVYLHGMWASPEDSCGYFEHATTPFGFLVCPRGNAPLAGRHVSGSAGAWSTPDGRMWTGTYSTVAPQLRAALDAAGRLLPGKLDRAASGTLIGYSNGAYFAVEVACSEPGRWTGLVLLSMRLELDVARLTAAGVQRVVLAAGEKDGARASMQALATRTDAAGLATRFVSLGETGHQFPPDLDARMCDAVAWVRESDPSACRSGF
jgi:predicted esterase